MPKRPAASPLKVSRLLLAAVALFAVSRIYLLVFFEPPMSDVGEVYFAYAAGAIDFHQTPYQGELTIEYPPLGWWTIAAPRLIDARRIADPPKPEQIGPIFRLYRSTFRSLMFLCDLASFLLLLLVMQKRRPAWTGWAALTYAICTTLLGPMLYDRLDTGLLFLFLAWAYCWIRSLDSTNPNSHRWAVAAYVAVGLGISFKLIPILSAPFLLLADGLAPGRLKRLAIVATALIAAAIGPFAIQYIVSGPALFSVFTYHSGRGIQIESLYASLMTLAAVFGLEISVNHAHGAYELDGALAPLLKMCSTVALVGFLLAAGLWALAQKSRFTRDDAYRLAAFVPAAAIILANVLSPQYFIWALPLLILVGAEILPEGNRPSWIFSAALATTAALTTWIFPYHYRQTTTNPIGLVPPDDVIAALPGAVASAVLSLRNTLYFATVVYLALRLVRLKQRLAATLPPDHRPLTGVH